MSFLDSFSDPLFKKSESGESIFYPWGVLGKGYVITSNAEADRIKATVKWCNFCAILVSIMCLQVLGLVYSLIFVGIYYVGYTFWTGSVTKGMAVASEKLRLSETVERMVIHYSPWNLVLMLVLALVLCILSAIMFFAEPEERGMAAIGFIFFGGCSLWFAYMLSVRRKSRRS
ncbi:MAG: hypothetical protein AB7V04_05475 [Desulfomonilaceae bacterium]